MNGCGVNVIQSLIIAHAEDKLYAGLLDVTVDFEENANLMRFMVTKAYSIQNYMYVWNYMKGYLDIEKSSSLGQFYCKKTFVLLGIEMAKVIRAEKSGKPGVKDREQQAHAYYYALPKFKDFVNVNKACFYETFVRGRCERRFKRIKTDHTAGHSEALQRMQDADSGTPPPSPPRVRDQSLSG
ncbi:hypothetical protein F4804DRAFT_297961 [Jackrogersella minutella]|nr:hypothetical protein F4804DRAFT_297961 [Jackrogersella minutella]